MFDDVCKLFATRARRSEVVRNSDEWSTFKRQSVQPQWVYLMDWNRAGGDVFSFGTSSNSSDRIRKSSVFEQKLTGKYDRRVDYLMMKVLFGVPRVHVFETVGWATDAESAAKELLSQRHCYFGIAGSDREEIARTLVASFKTTDHWAGSLPEDRAAFDEYLSEVFFARARHPVNPSRTFYWGDSLEPGFLRVIGKGHLEPAIERILKVRF